MNGYLREWRRERMGRCVSKAGVVHAVDGTDAICGAKFTDEAVMTRCRGCNNQLPVCACSIHDIPPAVPPQSTRVEHVRVVRRTHPDRPVSCLKCLDYLERRAAAHVRTGTGWPA